MKSDDSQEQVIKKLGKIVGNKKYGGASEVVIELFMGRGYTSDKMPFHKYIRDLDSDLSELKSMQYKLSRFKEDIKIQNILAQINDLMSILQKIKSYLISHKEFREEARYMQNLK